MGQRAGRGVEERIPIIDVAPLRGASLAEDAGRVVDEIGSACRDWGLFLILGHGVPSELLERFEAQQRRFFALPVARKGAVARDAANARGYYDRELTKNVRDWKEVFDVGAVPHPELPEFHPRNRGIDGVNRWPRELPEFRATVLEYFRAMEALSFRLLEALCASLGLAPTCLDLCFRPRHASFVRLNHYPRCPDPAPADAPDDPTTGQLGVNRHSDAGAFAVVWQDAVSALQVRRDERWFTVPSVPGALVVNLADMFQVWSNDRYRAPVHRVVARSSQERFSAPFFFNPSDETVCAPLVIPGAVEPPRYRPVPWAEFRCARSGGDYADLGEEIQIAHYRLP